MSRDPYQPYFPPQGGQGMLARPAAFMEPAQRYPRGYTPGRLREMTEALKDTHLSTGWGPPEKGLASQYEEKARVRETLARSTVPAAHVRGLESVTTGATLDSNTLGEYEHTSASFNPNSGRTRREPVARLEVGARMTEGLTLEEDMRGESAFADVNRVGRTLIHEVGHHVQNQPHLESGKAMRQRDSLHVMLMGDPTHEAGAENYADQHFREDPRFPAGSRANAYDTRLIQHWKNGPSRTGFDFEKRWTKQYEKNRNLSREQFVPKKEPKAKAPGRRSPGAGQMAFDQIEPHQGTLW